MAATLACCFPDTPTGSQECRNTEHKHIQWALLHYFLWMRKPVVSCSSTQEENQKWFFKFRYVLVCFCLYHRNFNWNFEIKLHQISERETSGIDLSCYYDTHLSISAPLKLVCGERAASQRSRWSVSCQTLPQHRTTSETPINISPTHRLLCRLGSGWWTLLIMVRHLWHSRWADEPAGRQTGIICGRGWAESSKNTLKRKRERWRMQKQNMETYITLE